MPIKSTKPPAGDFSPGTKPLPYLSHYALESEITASGQARAQVNAFNNGHLRATMPYSRAAEMRAGQAFRRQQEAAIRAENVGAAPYRGLGSVGLGKQRPLPDVGP